MTRAIDRLTSDEVWYGDPNWHPDGRRIIFASNRDDWRADIKQYGHNFELYLINIDGSGLGVADLGLERAVECLDDVEHRERLRVARQDEPASCATHGTHEARSAKRDEQLFEEFPGDVPPLRDLA